MCRADETIRIYRQSMYRYYFSFTTDVFRDVFGAFPYTAVLLLCSHHRVEFAQIATVAYMRSLLRTQNAHSLATACS